MVENTDAKYGDGIESGRFELPRLCWRWDVRTNKESVNNQEEIIKEVIEVFEKILGQ